MNDDDRCFLDVEMWKWKFGETKCYILIGNMMINIDKSLDLEV
jgi:hypothetical protein